MAKVISKIFLSLIILSTFFALGESFHYSTLNPTTAFADNSNTRDFQPAIIPKAKNLPGPEITNSTATRKLFGEVVLPKMAVYIIGFVGGLSLLFLIIGGARFAMSYSNEEDIGNAKNQVIYALVGLLIALLSYAIVAIVINLKFEGNQTPTQQPAQQNQPAPTSK